MREVKTRDLGKGFVDHGVALSLSSARGIVATADGDGRDVVLVWLMDYRGCAALLTIDADTGTSVEHAVPFPPGDDAPFASVLSSGNRFYSHFNGHFVEFDPVRKAFTFVHATMPKVGMGMTEDDQGRIWTLTYPDSGAIMYDPRTGEFRDYGSVHEENWRQYQRTVAADNVGWIYFSLGNTLSQILAFHPDSRKAIPLVPESERVAGVGAHVYRDQDGMVYGLVNQNHWEGPWYAFHGGKAARLDKPAPQHCKPIICGSQGLLHREFPSGRRIKAIDFSSRELIVEDPCSGTELTARFSYSSEGTRVMGVAAAPDGTISGGTTFPARWVSYDPGQDSWVDRPVQGQSNGISAQGSRFFIGGYTHGILQEWDTKMPWTGSKPKDEPGANPRILAYCWPTIDRPHCLLAHPDGRTVIMGGVPGYGYTGGGLLFWDRTTETSVLLKHTELLHDQCVMSLVALPAGRLLCGGGTRAGTGGEVKVGEAELYVLDMATKKVEWHAAPIPGVQEYSEMRMGPGGLVFGLADFRVYEPSLYDEEKLFFVFDPVRREIVYREETALEFGSIFLQQEQRKIVVSPGGRVYVLFRKGIACADPVTFKLGWVAESPVSIDVGGDWLDGRIYFVHGSHLCSYRAV